MKRKFFAILTFALVAVLCLPLAACKKKEPTAPEPPAYVTIADLAAQALEKAASSNYITLNITQDTAENSDSRATRFSLHFKKAENGYLLEGNGNFGGKDFKIYAQNNVVAIGIKKAGEQSYTVTQKQISLEEFLSQNGLAPSRITQVIDNAFAQFGKTAKYSATGYSFHNQSDLTAELNDFVSALRIAKDMRLATVLASYTAKTEAQLRSTLESMLAEDAKVSYIAQQIDEMFAPIGFDGLKGTVDTLQSVLGFTSQQIIAAIAPNLSGQEYPESAYDALMQAFGEATLAEMLQAYGSTLTATQLKDVVIKAIFSTNADEALSLKETVDLFAVKGANKIKAYAEANPDFEGAALIKTLADFVLSHESVTEWLCSLSAKSYTSAVDLTIDSDGKITQYQTVDALNLLRKVAGETNDYAALYSKITASVAYTVPDGVTFEIPSEWLQ